MATGIVPNLARPGGNVTGTSFFVAELGEALQLLREAMPRLNRVAVLMNADNVSMFPWSARCNRPRSDFERSFAEMASRGVDALVIVEDAMLNANAGKLGAAVTGRKMVSIRTRTSRAAAAFAYGVDQVEMFRRAAYYIDKIVKGANPGDLPIERVTKFELTVNSKAIKAVGIALPQTVLIRADRVVEGDDATPRSSS